MALGASLCFEKSQGMVPRFSEALESVATFLPILPGPVGGLDDELLLLELPEHLSDDLSHALQRLQVVLRLVVRLAERLALLAHGLQLGLRLLVLEKLLLVVGKGLVAGAGEGVNNMRLKLQAKVLRKGKECYKKAYAETSPLEKKWHKV